MLRSVIRIFLLACFFFFLAGLSQRICAQGTLQFNQVLLIGTSTATVPSGKVWKVESCLAQRTTTFGSSTGPGDQQFLINGQTISAGQGTSYSGSYGGVQNATVFPFWLPENATLKAASGSTYLSVIEFNVVSN